MLHIQTRKLAVYMKRNKTFLLIIFGAINVQPIWYADEKSTGVDAREPGSVHETRICKHSSV